jgi:hypothetical protein
MSGRVKIIKRKKSRASSKGKNDDMQSVTSELSNSSSKTSKTSKVRRVKKIIKKKSAASVISDQNLQISLTEIKKGRLGKKSSKAAKITLSSLKIMDKRLPPTEVPKPLKIPSFPDIDYNTLPPLQSDAKIRKAIESAAPNSQILIPKGVYKVQLSITKPLSIIGQGGVAFLSKGSGHTISINAKGVSLKGIAIVQRNSCVHSAVSCEGGSIRIESCVLLSDETPALVVTGDSVANVSSSSITSKGAPSIIATESCKCAFETCEVSQAGSTGLIIAGSSSVKVTKCNVANNKKCGIICRDSAKMYVEKSAISDSGLTGIEIGSSSNLTAVVSSSIVNCGLSGISLYGPATTTVSDTVITGCAGPAMDCCGGCSALLNGNAFSKCGEPSLIYLQEGATIESTNDTFSDAKVAGVCVFKNSELTLTNPEFNSLGRGVVVNDNGVLTLNNGKISHIEKTGIMSTGTTTIYINGTTIRKAGETGILINGTKTFEVTDSSIKHCALCGIDATSCTELLLTNCTLSGNKKLGLVATDSPTTVNGGIAEKNKFAAFEFIGCKGSLKETNVVENSIGIICTAKGSASVEKSNVNNNKKH